MSFAQKLIMNSLLYYLEGELNSSYELIALYPKHENVFAKNAHFKSEFNFYYLYPCFVTPCDVCQYG